MTKITLVLSKGIEGYDISNATTSEYAFSVDKEYSGSLLPDGTCSVIDDNGSAVLLIKSRVDFEKVKYDFGLFSSTRSDYFTWVELDKERVRISEQGDTDFSLSHDIKRDYISDGGAFCPKCQSNDIKTSDMEFDSSSTWQEVECVECGLKWNDIYTLTDIELT